MVGNGILQIIVDFIIRVFSVFKDRPSEGQVVTFHHRAFKLQRISKPLEFSREMSNVVMRAVSLQSPQVKTINQTKVCQDRHRGQHRQVTGDERSSIEIGRDPIHHCEESGVDIFEIRDEM